jgi:hypothetical protein
MEYGESLVNYDLILPAEIIVYQRLIVGKTKGKGLPAPLNSFREPTSSRVPRQPPLLHQ